MIQNMLRLRDLPTHYFTVALLAFAVFLAGIQFTPVPTVDGAIRAIQARYIVETGTWYPIHYGGGVFIDHPPLYTWLSAISFHIFGMSDWAANLPARIFAFLTVLVTFALAFKVSQDRFRSVLAALILVLTRDFVLSSVRGYIEPLIEFFAYLSFYLLLVAQTKMKTFYSVLAGISLFLCFFSKGPPALWPMVFLTILIIKQPKILLKFYLSLLTCCVLFLIWIYTNHYEIYWKRYLVEQVLDSAIKGRSGAQQFEYTYFIKILLKYYWPWLPTLLAAVYFLFKKHKKDFKKAQFLILGLGFVCGFSLVRWKFWYYIAPAYPAFSIFIALTIPLSMKTKTLSQIEKGLAVLATTWIVLASFIPFKLYRDRTPEVTQYKETIKNSPKTLDVYLLSTHLDHNQIGTSGEWYFGREVRNKEPVRPPAWIITDENYTKSCTKPWCKQGILVQETDAFHSKIRSQLYLWLMN
ncbi:MAG: ArnT family glycosyltransferase [Bacteriovoracia bacterium]